MQPFLLVSKHVHYVAYKAMLIYLKDVNVGSGQIHNI